MKTDLPVVPSQLRFVLLYHMIEAVAGRGNHWDLMLEQDGVLITFEVARLPSQAGPFQARRLVDHRLAYLDYEGQISGNRGSVIRLDRGYYAQASADDRSHEEQRFPYTFYGERLNATIVFDHPVEQIPLGESIQCDAIRWDWND